MKDGDISKPLKVLPNQRQRLEVADTLVELRRSLQIRKDKRNIADPDSLRSLDLLGPEQFAESLRRDEPLRGKMRLEIKYRATVRNRIGKLNDRHKDWMIGFVRGNKSNRPRCNLVG
jgi:hypothetical protein